METVSVSGLRDTEIAKILFFVIARPQAVAIHAGLASAVAVDCRASLAMTTLRCFLS